MTSHDASLPDDIARLQALLLRERETTAQLSQTVQSQQRTIDAQEQRIAQLLRLHYGPRQERIDPAQLLLFDEAELEALIAERRQEAAQSDAPQSPTKRPGHGRRALGANLPRETRLYELTPAERCCPGCGVVRCEIGRDTSEQLEFEPARFKVIEHVRVKYACRACEEYVAIAAKPPQPVEKGLPGPGLLAHTVLAKYGDHLPLYRQEDQAARYGVVIRRSTLCDWTAAAADLAENLVRRMCERVLESRIVHTDDTTVKLLVPLLGKAKTARFWAYIGDARHPYTVYDFTESRSRDGPAKFLRGFRGYLQADAYGGYDGIYTGSQGAIVEVACWAHARRYWFEARTTDPQRAHHALGVIARLYQVETACAGQTSAERYAARQAHALPLLTEFGAWLDEQSLRLLPKSPIGAAATYTRNQWAALLRYVEDGELAIDNNVSERTVKMQAIGRRNWLFVGSPAGGRRAAILFSLTASCKACGVEPWAYLRDVFARLPAIPADRVDLLDDLLPDRWLATHPTHHWDIDALRRAERKRRKQELRSRRRK